MDYFFHYLLVKKTQMFMYQNFRLSLFFSALQHIPFLEMCKRRRGFSHLYIEIKISITLFYTFQYQDIKIHRQMYTLKHTFLLQFRIKSHVTIYMIGDNIMQNPELTIISQHKGLWTDFYSFAQKSIDFCGICVDFFK